MKGFNIFVAFFLFIAMCSGQEINEGLISFGDEIEASGSMTSLQMSEKYKVMVVADTVQSKFTGVVKEVCQSKGCWMKVVLEDGKEAMVRFKDYGFFMPKDIAGKEVIINGLAFVEEMSVDDQKHYAEDAGKSADEIAEITKPKRTLGFEADGVLLKE